MRSTPWAGTPKQVETAKRAASRIKNEPATHFYGALVEFPGSTKTIPFAEIFAIRPLQEPPEALNSILNVQRGMSNSMSGVPLDLIFHEVTISREWAKDIEQARNFSALACLALRMRTQTPFFVPAVCDCSWETLAGQEENSASVLSAERPLNHDLVDALPPETFSDTDAAWISENFNTMLGIANNDERYRFALQCRSLADFDLDLRMAATRLWGGIESLFDVSQEIRFRLSAMIASLVHQPGAPRLALYDETKKLYDSRSKIVHGRTIRSDALLAHVLRVRALLSDCLVRIVEFGHLPTARELEKLMLGIAIDDPALGSDIAGANDPSA